MPRTIPPAPCPTPTAAPAPASNCSDGEPCRVEAAAAATDLNIMVLVAAIICAFVCALGLNSMLQCVVRCASRTLIEPIEWANSRRLNSGLKRKEMVALPISIYAAGLGSPSPSGCAICLMDYSEGEKIRVLPKCNHRFHVACIDKWLLCHSSCPTCRNRVNSNDNTTCSSL